MKVWLTEWAADKHYNTRTTNSDERFCDPKNTFNEMAAIFKFDSRWIFGNETLIYDSKLSIRCNCV